jgi:peptide chain release factor
VSVHLLLSAGRGPQECAWALAQLLGCMEADAARRNLESQRVRTVRGAADGARPSLEVRRVETVPGGRPGTYRSVLVQISGSGAGAFAASWTGTLCWQAPSPYRASAGRKNWYVIARPCQTGTQHTTFAETDVDIVGCRTGGPGGQHRNKASTAVRATHRPSGIVVVADTERQFSLNRRIAMQLIRQRIEQADEAAGRAAATARWRVHDELVRGNPTRVERPESPGQDLVPRGSARKQRGQSTRPRSPR